MSDEAAKTSNLVVRRVIAATPEALFQMWTQPEHLRKWWGPKGVSCPEAEVDLRVGGSYQIGNELPDGRIVWIKGEFELIEPPHRLRYTWGLGLDSESKERVTVTFEATDGGTEVVVCHENVAEEAARKGHEAGWVGCLEGLADYVECLAAP